MIARVHTLIAAVLFHGVVICLTGCTAPQATQAVPSGSAAFASFAEPWQKDLVRSVAPVYSYSDRAAWRQGSGVFHLVIDRSTGSVVQVSVPKSTGYPTLDNAAVAALKQWRFRPASWKTLDIPVHFRMASTHEQYRQRVRHGQQQARQL